MATSRRTIHVTAGTGASFGASTLQQEIGLGAAQAISQLIIHWPSGVIQTFGEVQVDRKYVVREDASALEAVALQPLALAQTGGGHPH